MSTAELKALRNAAMALSESERAKLARDLVASLDGTSDEELVKAWDIEICRRVNETENGQAQLLDVEEVLLCRAVSKCFLSGGWPVLTGWW